MSLDLRELAVLATRAADLILRGVDTAPITRLAAACQDGEAMSRWVQGQSVSWLAHPANGDVPFTTATMTRALLDDTNGGLNRDMFFNAVIGELHRRGYTPADADATAAQEVFATPHNR